MKYALWMLLLCPMAAAVPCPTSPQKDGNTLVQIEQNWARALEQRDTAALGCILGDEFEDAGPDGQLTSRATTLAKAAEHPPVRIYARMYTAISATSGDWRRPWMHRAKLSSRCASPMSTRIGMAVGNASQATNRW